MRSAGEGVEKGSKWGKMSDAPGKFNRLERSRKDIPPGWRGQ